MGKVEIEAYPTHLAQKKSYRLAHSYLTYGTRRVSSETNEFSTRPKMPGYSLIGHSSPDSLMPFRGIRKMKKAPRRLLMRGAYYPTDKCWRKGFVSMIDERFDLLRSATISFYETTVKPELSIFP